MDGLFVRADAKTRQMKPTQITEFSRMTAVSGLL